MKKLIVLMVLLISLAVPVLAADMQLVDDADVLTAEQEQTVLEKMEEAGDASGLDFVIVTVDGIGNQEPIEYADDYYDEHPYEVMFLLDMGERQWWIEARDDGAGILTESVIEWIGDEIAGELSDGNYADALTIFLDQCVYYANEPFDVGGSLLLALIVGVVVALIVTLVWRSKLKSVRFKTSAGDYVKSGSLAITNSHDLYLYSTVTRVRRQQNNSSSSSSGGSRSGGGGRF